MAEAFGMVRPPRASRSECCTGLCTVAEGLLDPVLVEACSEKLKDHGPTLAGALFAAGHWFWLDAVCVSPNRVPFVRYIPGILATLACAMTAVVRRDDLEAYDSYGDGGDACRARGWLFGSYVVSAAAVAGAAAGLVASYGAAAGPAAWPGAAGVLQVVLVLGGALALFASRGGDGGDGFGGGGYSAF